MQTALITGADTALGAQSYANGALSAAATLVAAAPGSSPGVRPRVLYAADLFNPAAATTYLQLFNAAAAASVTVGTTAPTLVLGVAAGAGRSVPLGDVGARFDAGIVAAATTTPTGSAGPATALVVSLVYA